MQVSPKNWYLNSDPCNEIYLLSLQCIFLNWDAHLMSMAFMFSVLNNLKCVECVHGLS